MKENHKNPVAKTMKAVLDATLRRSANSASCCVIHQPKAPKKLEEFRKFK